MTAPRPSTHRFLPLPLLCALLVASLAFSQSSRAQDIEHDAQVWHLAATQGRVHDRVVYWLEAQPRFALDPPRLSPLLLRSAVGFQVVPQVSFWLGYAWIPVWSESALDSVRFNEGRLFQQVLYNDRFGPVTVQSRTRLEQRLIEGAAGVSHRVRSLARVGVDVPYLDVLSVVVWDEPFFHISSVEGGPQQGFDQNRLFLGVSLRPTPHFTVEAGYLNVLLFRPDQPARMIHAPYTFTVWSFF